MTFKKWHGLYKHFKNYHDFTVTRRTFHELDEQNEKEESNEWFDDQKGHKNMEKILCPICNNTLLYASYIKGQIKCKRCKNIIDMKKEKSWEHTETKQVLKQLRKTFL